jgi:aromatic ring hydroxylase
MSNFGKTQSKFKLVIYLKRGEKKVYYSLENEEKVSDDKAIRGMIRRLLYHLYKDKYQTAIIYEQYTGKEKHKFINGVQEF